VYVIVIESFFVRVKKPIPDATVKKKNVRASGTINNNNNAFLLNYIFYFFADDDFEETKRLFLYKSLINHLSPGKILFFYRFKKRVSCTYSL
jgi:hypothetical protein